MDVVIFQVEGQLYAIEAQFVPEVLDPQPITLLPFVPEYVDGLVSVAGSVLPQIDLGRKLGMESTLDKQAGNLLVVARENQRHAVHVERVLVKATMANEAVSLYGSSTETGREGLVKGEFIYNEAPVLILEPGAIGIDGLSPVGVPASSGGLLGENGAIKHDDAAGSQERFPCLVVTDGGEYYAFRFSEVREVLEGSILTRVPKAPGEVAGIALVRGVPILNLSLGALLGGGGESGATMMVVVEKDRNLLGLLVEKVSGIERFSGDEIQRVLKQDADLEGYLPGHGEKMVGLLSLENLLSAERLESYREFMVASDDRQAQRGSDGGVIEERRKLLTFTIGNELCALPLELVERIEERQVEVRTPEECGGKLAGVVQSQGNVVPVLDMRRELGMEQGADGCGTYLLTRAGDSLWALVVDKVERVLEFADSELEPVKRCDNEYLSAVGRKDGRLYSILGVEPIAQIAGSA